MYSYQAYGLSIASEWRFPELTELSTPHDIQIRRADLEFPGLKPNREGSCVRVSSEKIFLARKRIGIVSIQSRDTILVDADPQANPDELRHYILSQGLGTLLHQRGHVVLHGSAVRIETGAIVFIGPAGWGKSTLAASAYLQGHGFLSDDVTAIDPVSHSVVPSYPQIKLWTDAANALGIPGLQLRPIFPGWEKNAFGAARDFSTQPVPVRSVFVLREGPGPWLEKVSPQDALRYLLSHAYCRGLTDKNDFLRGADLVNHASVFILRLEWSLNRIHDTIRRLSKEHAHVI
jgi:hypothetical protein